ncbi:MAG: hypothetical protein NTX22_03850 [Ignavibacteriales bacterium]|nr:hypothetical protein [Ignavibacteriales bacterium]
MKRDNLLFIIIIVLLFCITNNSFCLSSPKWTAEVYYVSDSTANIYIAPFLDSTVVGKLKYLDKCIIIINEDNSNLFGWRQVVYPISGFIQEKFLFTPKEKTAYLNHLGYEDYENEKSQWHILIKFCRRNYCYIKEKPDFQSTNIGIIEKREKLVIVEESNFNNQVWSKIIFPVTGYVLSEDITSDLGSFTVGVGASYGIGNVPYEKNFSNMKDPLGGFIDFSQTNGNFSLRFGYNYAESNISKYILKTQLIYSHITYTFLRTIKDHLNLYILAGGGYWLASFQNKKYGTSFPYFPLDKDKGIGYLVGGGLIINIFGFFIDGQYIFLGSKMAVFGKEPLPGEFTNQYKLYPGSNQVNLTLGYRFVF